MDHFRPKQQYRSNNNCSRTFLAIQPFNPGRRIGSFLPLLCPGLNYFGPSGRLTVDVKVVLNFCNNIQFRLATIYA